MSNSASQTSLSTRTMNAVKSYASKLTDLPEPSDGEWTREEVPDHIVDRLRFFENRNIIERTKHRTEDDGPAWRTPRRVWAALKRLGAFQSNNNKLPCGHIGFRNPRDSPKYECRTCEDEFTYEELPDSFK